MDDNATSHNDYEELLAKCSAEDLSRMGLVQPHGCLVGINADKTIQFAAGNSSYFFDHTTEDMLGLETTTLRLPDGKTIAEWIDALSPLADTPRHAGCYVDGVFIADIYGHQSEDHILLECIVPSDVTGSDTYDATEAIDAIEASSNIFMAAASAVGNIRKLSGYDRVMVYRFHADASGDVIAEDRKDDLVHFIGLRYPATDIPENARKLYLKSTIRIVADSRAEPHHIKSLDPTLSCNLGLAKLRSVSPFHTEYLKNMNVGATLVTSIIVNGKLWGLVACHHGHAFVPSENLQNCCVQITKALADKIEKTTAQESEGFRQTIVKNTDSFIGELSINGTFWYTALFGRNRLIALIDIHGCAIRIGEEIYTVGYCPPHEAIWELNEIGTSHCLQREEQTDYPVWTCTNIKSRVGDFESPSAGAAIVVINETPHVSVMVFRNELKREVFWGGNPDKSMEISGDAHHLSPRRSFERWSQIVTDTCAEWGETATGTLRNIALKMRAFPDQEFASFLGAGEIWHPVFADIITNDNVSEVRSIIEDFIPEGIATVAFSNISERSSLSAFANATFCEFFGLSRAEVDEQKIKEILRSSGLEYYGGEILSDSEKVIGVTSRKFGQRLVKARSVNLLCQLDRSGIRNGVKVMYLHDETDRQRILDALDVTKRQREATSQFKSQILGGLSHELRTPLNAIIGYMEMLKMGIVTDQEKTMEYIGTVYDVGREMLNLVEGLLDIARIEKGILQLEEQEFDLLEEIRASYNIVSQHASAHEQTIDINLGEKPVTLLGDKTAVRQMLVNLLENAVKFSPQGGRIILSLEITPLQSLKIHIEDNGPGVEPENRTAIFEPFSQVEGLEVRSKPGAGIGLGIVKAYIELHGGTAVVEESSIGGAKFTISFPSWRVTV